VDVSCSTNIYDLKKKTKEKKHHSLNQIDAGGVMVWKLCNPLPHTEIQQVDLVSLIQDDNNEAVREVLSSEKVSVHFMQSMGRVSALIQVPEVTNRGASYPYI